jgi:hypothetical protein
MALLAPLAMMAGCPAETLGPNAFLTFTEAFGASAFNQSDEDLGAGGGVAAQAAFRQQMTFTLANNHPDADLNVSVIAWISPSSIRSADQQDELLDSGFVQLTREVRIGDALILVPGTFVLNGPGVGGATAVTLPGTGAEDATIGSAATTRSFTFVTPDGILFFSQPPVSCESVAFFYSVDGDALGSTGLFNGQSTGSGVSDIFPGPDSPFSGAKTLNQVDAYECSPFRPGLFLRIGGGQLADNEYQEGQDIQVDFSQFADAAGDFAFVTKS